ncbi:MAG TPA: hypothetical protein VF855_04805 [Acidimicrobiales bacterium]
MASIDDPIELHRRAAVLRLAAQQIERLDAHRLRLLGGDSTWCGPRAQAFQADARAAGRLLDRASQELVEAARALEWRVADHEGLVR